MKKKPTEIIFSFDTENFTSNHGADGILTEAEILREAGVRGCFCVTALLAQQLVNWGRNDVLDALKYHEIDSHTYGHTLHPNIDEYTDIESYDEALKEFFRQEKQAVEMLKDVFGIDRVYAAVPPGRTRSYVSMYGYADMGIPIYSGTTCATDDGHILSYCNIAHICYSYCLEACFYEKEHNIDKLIEDFAEKERVVIYTHPDMSLYSQHWDIVNYKSENKHPFGEWEEAPRRTAEESAYFYENMKEIVNRLKNDDRFCFTTYKELGEQLGGEGKRVITKSDIPYLREQLNKNFYPVDKPQSLCLSDIFSACRALLTGEEQYVCRNAYGFLEEPYAIENPVLLNSEDIIKSAFSINKEGFLPAKIKVGEVDVGPADWLRAALAVLCGEKSVLVEPDVQMPNLDIMPYVRDKKYEFWWIVFMEDYKDRYISERLYLQAWTLRFPNLKNR